MQTFKSQVFNIDTLAFSPLKAYCTARFKTKTAVFFPQGTNVVLYDSYNKQPPSPYTALANWSL